MLTPESNKKLFLIDAYAIIFRAYFAFAKNPRVNSQGLNTSAAFGFTNSLMEVIKKEKPTHIAVVFDPPGGSTSRKETFEEYKANRNKNVQDSAVFELMNNYKLNQTSPRIEIPQWEADDVIAYMAKRVRIANPNRDIILYTTDADLKTLNVTARVQTPWIKSLSDISAADIHLYKTLVGDSSDNIKGCKGFGATAWTLLSEDHKHTLSQALEKDEPACPLLENCKYSNLLQLHWQSVKMAYKLVDFRYDETLPKLIEKHYVSGSKV